MNLPKPDDFIDIHIHDGTPSAGIFLLQSLMAHEQKKPVEAPGIAYTIGIHPWFLNDGNSSELLKEVNFVVNMPGILAVGEAGFDKLKGPSLEFQRKIFEEQVLLSEELRKPVVIHCVRAWDELLSVHKKLKPRMPWLVHGFRGSYELANQLLSRGMYLSFWFEFVTREESGVLLKRLPSDRIFLETDGADTDIRSIYRKVAVDLSMSENDLKRRCYMNFHEFFKLDT